MKNAALNRFESAKWIGLSDNTFYLILLLFSLIGYSSIENAIAADTGFSVSKALPVQIIEQTNNDQKQISFTAFDKTFNLVLQENKPLMKNYEGQAQGIKLYAGTIEDSANSWARISVIDGEYSGALYDGDELYLLDSGEALVDVVAAESKLAMLRTRNAIYRASDLSSTSTCAVHSTHDHPEQSFSYDKLVSNLKNQRATNSDQIENFDITVGEATASQQINVSIVADTQYAAANPNNPEAQLLSQMNIVDGIFSEQVDVQFGIQEIRVLTDNGPLASTNASTLLGQYQSFIGNDNPGLSHLFTGRNLDGSTAGIAFLNATCTANGVGLTQIGNNDTTTALIAAHEFGHNFGAPHDNQSGSVCVATPGTFLMNPFINGSNQFSQCSLQQIDNLLSFNSRSFCLVDIEPEPDPIPEDDDDPTSDDPSSDDPTPDDQDVFGIILSLLPVLAALRSESTTGN